MPVVPYGLLFSLVQETQLCLTSGVFLVSSPEGIARVKSKLRMVVEYLSLRPKVSLY